MKRTEGNRSMATTPKRDDHICATQAVCFQCFKAGMERVRARREAWAQRSLPFEEPARNLRAAVANRSAQRASQALAAK